MGVSLITFSAAAKEKDCSHQTLRDAAARGDLNSTEFLGRKALFVDDKYVNWSVSLWGGRIKKLRDAGQL